MEGTFQGFRFDWIGLLIGICLISVVLLIVVALWMYRDAGSRAMDATVWLVLLILATVFGGFIGLAAVVVIYLVVRGSHPVIAGMPPGYAPYPTAPYLPPATAACQVCGRPMTWYPGYQRWYCWNCGQYR